MVHVSVSSKCGTHARLSYFSTPILEALVYAAFDIFSVCTVYGD